jgi:hypothetical protein
MRSFRNRRVRSTESKPAANETCGHAISAKAATIPTGTNEAEVRLAPPFECKTSWCHATPKPAPASASAANAA